MLDLFTHWFAYVAGRLAAAMGIQRGYFIEHRASPTAEAGDRAPREHSGVFRIDAQALRAAATASAPGRALGTREPSR